jgi:hypothetical protein
VNFACIENLLKRKIDIHMEEEVKELMEDYGLDQDSAERVVELADEMGLDPEEAVEIAESMGEI